MRQRLFTAIVFLAIVAGFIVWASYRLTRQDQSMVLISTVVGEPVVGFSPPPAGAISNNGLEDRMLVWCTNANVPLKIAFDGEGRGLLQTLGVPEFLRPGDIPIGREPVSDQWNVATMRLSMSGDSGVRFLSYDDGYWAYTNPTADGKWILATRSDENTSKACMIDSASGEKRLISPSYSLDRYPSSNLNGTRILFHSFRNDNPGGDLYIASGDLNQNSEFWEVMRITDNPNVQYEWPKISADSSVLIAIEHPVGQLEGKVVYWSMIENVLQEPRYLTDEPETVSFPSLNFNGNIACWQVREDNRSRLVVWTIQDGILSLDIRPSESDHPVDLDQPSLSPDGRYVVFVENHPEAGADKIGICELSNGVTGYFEGCGGVVEFPAISNSMPKLNIIQ